MEKLNYSQKIEGKTTILFKVALPLPLFLAYRAPALARLSKNLNLPGFRPDHIPEKAILEKIGEGTLLSEMAERAVTDCYAQILKETKCMAIGRPQVDVTELSLEKPLVFSITTEFIPEIKLPDYKKIAKNEYSAPKESVSVEKKEVEDVIRQLGHQSLHEENPSTGSGFSSSPSGTKESADHNHQNPEIILDDALASRISPFKTIAELNSHIEKNILAEKERHAQEVKRISVIKKIATLADITVPETIIDQDLMITRQKLEQEVKSRGLTWESFLKKEGKTEAELRELWRPHALEEAKISLVLSEIARLEALTVPDEEVKKETEKLIQYYGGEIVPERAKNYVREALANRKVHLFLETIK